MMPFVLAVLVYGGWCGAGNEEVVDVGSDAITSDLDLI
jgi:hypothetical protein